MKILLDSLETPVEFSRYSAAILSFTDVSKFRSVSELVYSTFLEADNGLVSIFHGDEHYSTRDTMLFFTDYYSFDFNQRTIQGKVQKSLEQSLQANTKQLSFIQENLRQVCVTLSSLNQVDDYDIAMKEYGSALDVVKLFNISIDTSRYTTVLERIYGVVDLASSLQIAKVIVTLNCDLYLTLSERNELYKYLGYKGLYLLDIRSMRRPVEGEAAHVILIDDEYDEIQLA